VSRAVRFVQSLKQNPKTIIICAMLAVSKTVGRAALLPSLGLLMNFHGAVKGPFFVLPGGIRKGERG
jgi:hypothetical protein